MHGGTLCAQSALLQQHHSTYVTISLQLYLISRVTLSIPWHLEGTDIYHQPDAALGRDRLCQDQGLKITEEPSVRQCVEKCFRICRVSSFTMACMGSVHHFDAVGMYCTLQIGCRE